MTDFADLWPVPHGRLVPDIDSVYRERNFVVAALAKLATLTAKMNGAWLARHEGSGWEDDWRWVVYIDFPEVGQVSWHIHDSELPLFAGFVRFVPSDAGNLATVLFPDGRVQQVGLGRDTRYLWDGHTTEEKYRRLYEYVTG